MQKTAKQEIEEFLQSPFVGMTSDFSKGQLQRAAETLFIANGVNSPVRIVTDNRTGQACLIKNDVLNG